ncbi:MAG: hypothetical protein GKR88_02185 [Flavobacteriaceae bacterium]|nr:MAG: hypothetical protein GKR88_02185 [Flavobacteriaceae bacterium]
MKTPTQKEAALTALGMNHGYILALAAPSLLERIKKMEHVPAYKKGLLEAEQQIQKNREKITQAKQKQQARKAKLAQIKAKQQKEQGKNEKER